MGRILTVANQKGGVGKTTTSVNLGASLAAAEKSTLVVDLDPQGNATSGLGIDPMGLEVTVYDALIGVRSASDVVVSSELDYLDLLPANRDLAGAEIELVDAEERHLYLRKALEIVRDSYDYVVIDCPPSLGLLTVNALSCADAVIVPLQCEYYALEGLSRLLDTIGMIRQSINPSLEIDGILLTMFDKRTSLSDQVAQEVRENFDGTVFETVIPRNVRLSESPSFGKPALLYDARSMGSKCYLEFAKEYLEMNR